MELKAGYKATEVGVIPEEWSVCSLGELTTFVASGTSKNKALHGSYAVHGSTGVIGYSETADYSGDAILVARVGANAGKLNLVRGQYGVTDNTIIVRLGERSFLPFVWYLLESKRLNRLVFGSGQPLITGTQLKSLPVCVPPLPEQRAIAEALGDVDALVSGLDQLITKKRGIKQAAMQQLLTGEQRLPGFRGEWEVKTLGSLGAWLSGGTPSMSVDQYWSGDIPWVSPKDMKVPLLHDTIDHVSNGALGNGTRLLPAGAILIVVRGMILAHSLPVARAMRPVAFNQDIKGLIVAADIDSSFILWWLIANEPLLLSKTTESTHGTKRMPTETLFEVKIALPELPEQTAIAAVLSDMDAEISALEQRREKTRALKQGMMQELLTGRTRLV